MTLPRIKLSIIFITTLALAILVCRQTPGLNGPWYWQWPWKKPTGLTPYVYLLAALIPLLLAEYFFDATPSKMLPGILLMMAAVFAAQLALRFSETPGVPYVRIISIIEGRGSTGYFTHAEDLVNSHQPLRGWLANFPQKMSTYSLHARNKPPGSILFYVPFFHLTDTEDAAALAAGLTIAFLTTLTIPATWLLIRQLTNDSTAAFRGAAYLSITPGLILFFPEFDQFYPLYTAILLILWIKSLKSPNPTYPILLGLTFAFICFQTFNLLVLGVFAIGYAILFPNRALALRQATIAATTLIAVYFIFWLFTCYNPIQTLLTGIKLHNQDMPATHRVLPGTIPFDLSDFALGAGWISIPLIAMYFATPHPNRRHWPLALLCLLQPLVVALTGVLQGETARVWTFLLPLLMVPLSLELSRWPRSHTLAALICLWVLTAVLSQNMIFIY